MRVVLAVLCALLSAPALALDPARSLDQYGLDSFQSKDGLPQNSVQAITETPDGYLWLGTQEGLVRFDGQRFAVFDRTNTPAFANNHVTALLPSSPMLGRAARLPTTATVVTVAGSMVSAPSFLSSRSRYSRAISLSLASPKLPPWPPCTMRTGRSRSLRMVVR